VLEVAHVAGAPAIPQGTPDWHQLRVCRITASDVAACIGRPRYTQQTVEAVVQSKLDAYLQLLKGEPITTAHDSPSMAYGRAVEGAVADAWLQHLHSCDPNAVMQTTGLHVHPEYPYIAASPDRLVRAAVGGEQQLRLLEVKTRPKSGLPSVLPEHDRLQVLTQLACVDKAVEGVVVYYKAGPDGRAAHTTFVVKWDAAARAEWAQVVIRLQHAYFQDLAPALVQLKARVVGVLLPQRPPVPTRIMQTVPTTELGAAEAAYTPPSVLAVGVHVVCSMKPG
jgi:putative phage-type endonuclease